MKNNIFSIVKFLLFVIMIPFLYAVILAFGHQANAIPQQKLVFLLAGLGGFVGVYLFIYHFREVYEFGFNLVCNLFSFAKPVGEVIAYIFPTYALLFIVGHVVLNAAGALDAYEPLDLFFIGFTLMMHVVLTAEKLREEDKHLLRGNYFFAFSLALVFFVVIVSIFMAVLFKDFNLANFFNAIIHKTLASYTAIYKFLFVTS